MSLYILKKSSNKIGIENALVDWGVGLGDSSGMCPNFTGFSENMVKNMGLVIGFPTMKNHGSVPRMIISTYQDNI